MTHDGAGARMGAGGTLGNIDSGGGAWASCVRPSRSLRSARRGWAIEVASELERAAAALNPGSSTGLRTRDPQFASHSPGVVFAAPGGTQERSADGWCDRAAGSGGRVGLGERSGTHSSHPIAPTLRHECGYTVVAHSSRAIHSLTDRGAGRVVRSRHRARSPGIEAVLRAARLRLHIPLRVNSSTKRTTQGHSSPHQKQIALCQLHDLGSHQQAQLSR